MYHQKQSTPNLGLDSHVDSQSLAISGSSSFPPPPFAPTASGVVQRGRKKKQGKEEEPPAGEPKTPAGKLVVPFQEQGKMEELAVDEGMLEHIQEKEARFVLRKLKHIQKNWKVHGKDFSGQKKEIGAYVKKLEQRFGELNSKKEASEEFKKTWKGDFYGEMKTYLEDANSKNKKKRGKALKVIKKLLEDIDPETEQGKANRKWLHGNCIRKPAQKKNEDDDHGVGLDELLQTAHTDEWISRSAGLAEKTPSGKQIQPYSLYNGKKFNWLDAQEHLRVQTDTVMWIHVTEDGTKTNQGHTGNFRDENKKGKFLTKDQASFHGVRNTAEFESSTPRNAVIRGLTAHINNTANKESLLKGDVKLQGITSDGINLANLDLDGRKAWAEEMMSHRDTLKKALKEFEAKSEEVNPEISAITSPPRAHHWSEPSPFNSPQPASINAGSLAELGETMNQGFNSKK